MSNPEDFRRYAQRCTEIARHVPHDEAETLSAMAEAWTRLAEDEERIADLIRDADKTFAGPHTPAAAQARLAFWDADRVH